MFSRPRIRVLALCVLLFCTVPFAQTIIAGEASYYANIEEGRTVAEPRANMTAISGGGPLVVLWPNGTVRYLGDTHGTYWDVDFTSRDTVLVTVTDGLSEENVSACNPLPQRGTDHCQHQSLLLINLTTAEETVLYDRIDPKSRSSEWHDADHLAGDLYVIADMYNDRVMVVNATTKTISWSWNVQQYAPISSGGPFPSDWVHLNNVEVLDSGVITVSLRNQDQVIFLTREGDVLENMTLGEDDRHAILNEQHNPDYIPEARGGPALLIADSENSRIIEYQRDGNEWRQSWVWNNTRTQWPRDADRLPNGHTLINNGGAVVEIDKQGKVVWQFKAPRLYEVERYDGDPESTGPSAERAGLESNTVTPSEEGLFKRIIKAILPSWVINSIFFITPSWMGISHYIALAVGLAITFAWASLELYWADLTIQSPVVRKQS